MQLTAKYVGFRQPFEGDRTLWLRSLPAQAYIEQATVTLTPTVAGAASFERPYTFVFDELPPTTEALSATAWGITVATGTTAAARTVPPPADTPLFFAEIDLHRPLTLTHIRVDNAAAPGQSAFQVHLSGVFMTIAADGTLLTPSADPATPPPAWQVPDADAADPADAALPRLSSSKFRLDWSPRLPLPDPFEVPAPPQFQIQRVTARSAPTNVRVSIGQLPPFWTQVGELAIAQTSPNFANSLNIFLQNAPVDAGFYAIPFVIHSDTLAELTVTLTVEYSLKASVLPDTLPEVTLPYRFSTLPLGSLAPLTLRLPSTAKIVPERSTVSLAGTFEATRIAVGDLGAPLQPPLPVLVSPACALAQPFTVSEAIAITGIDLPLANWQSGASELNIAIQADFDGTPAGEILASAAVTLAPSPLSATHWGTATLAEPLQVEPRRAADGQVSPQRYWLILQSQTGQAYWESQPAAPTAAPLHCSRNGGLAWQPLRQLASPTATVAAQFRLRQTPAHFTLPLQLQLGQGHTARRFHLKQLEAVGQTEFELDLEQLLNQHLQELAPFLPPRPPELIVNAAVSLHYSAAELLTNGRFDAPPPRDGMLPIFGFDAAVISTNQTYQDVRGYGAVDLRSTVDLSALSDVYLRTNGVTIDMINCAGADPARTSGEEIATAINKAIANAFPPPGDGSDSSDHVAHRTESAFQAMYEDTTGLLQLSAYGGSLHLGPWYTAQLPQGWQAIAGNLSQVMRLKLPYRFVKFTHEYVGGYDAHIGHVFLRNWHTGHSADERFQLDTANGDLNLEAFSAFQKFLTSDTDKNTDADNPEDLTVVVLRTGESHRESQAAQLVQTVSVIAGLAYQLQVTCLHTTPALASTVFTNGGLPLVAPLPDRLDEQTAPFVEVAWLNQRGQLIRQQRRSLSETSIYLYFKAFVPPPASSSTLPVIFNPDTGSGSGSHLRRTPARLGDATATVTVSAPIPYEFSAVTATREVTSSTEPDGAVTVVDAGRVKVETKIDDGQWQAATTAEGELIILNLPGQSLQGNLPETTLLPLPLQATDLRLVAVSDGSDTPNPSAQVSLYSVTLRQVGEVTYDAPQLKTVDIQWSAPATATQAEVRLVQPQASLLVVDAVSFKAASPAPALPNRQRSPTQERDWPPLRRQALPPVAALPPLQPRQPPLSSSGETAKAALEGLAPGWVLESGLLDITLDDFPLVGLTRLRGDADRDTVLSQRLTVTGGDLYTLNLIAHLRSPQPSTPTPVPHTARLELHWLNDTDELLSPPVSIVLRTQDFASHAWSGYAPAAATQVKLHIIQPQGQGQLILETISFSALHEIELPISFLAEAPGELTLSNFQIGYDIESL